MPQVELHYTQGLELDFAALFSAIERLINQLDASAGICKSRAYQCEYYLHDHVYISILMMRKLHRDAVFMQNCHERLLTVIKEFLPATCSWSVSLDFSSPYYAAGENL